MLEIKRSRIDRNNWYDYYLKDENNQLNIIFMGNGDLYFTPNILCKNCKSEFLITKENMIIYNLFTQLFEDFNKCEIFNVEEYELEYMDSFEKKERFQRNKSWNKELKESTIYKKSI